MQTQTSMSVECIKATDKRNASRRSTNKSMQRQIVRQLQQLGLCGRVECACGRHFNVVHQHAVRQTVEPDLLRLRCRCYILVRDRCGGDATIKNINNLKFSFMATSFSSTTPTLYGKNSSCILHTIAMVRIPKNGHVGVTGVFLLVVVS